jgi:hypothetical protein
MGWRRRKRVDLGAYVAPEPVEPSPPERVATEGVAIAEAVIRLGLHNRIVVDSLRDRRGYATEPLRLWAAAEFEQLATLEEAAAERLREKRDWSAPDPLIEDSDTVDAERRELRWREAARRATAAAFRERARNDQRLIELVEQARIEAWHDVANVIIDRADVAVHHADARYAAERSDRMAQLVALDLTELAIERGTPLS